MSRDKIIVVGASCCWWDGIDKVGSNGRGPLGSLPCCPYCKGVLFEYPSMGQWMGGVLMYEEQGHAGYGDFITWLRGKHFMDYGEAKTAYEAETGATVNVDFPEARQ